MQKCKRLIKEFDRAAKAEEGRSSADTSRMLSEKKQSMVCWYLDANRVDLIDAPGTEGHGQQNNVLLAESS